MEEKIGDNEVDERIRVYELECINNKLGIVITLRHIRVFYVNFTKRLSPLRITFVETLMNSKIDPYLPADYALHRRTRNETV